MLPRHAPSGCPPASLDHAEVSPTLARGWLHGYDRRVHPAGIP
jgi:hypothetical protein